MTNLTNEEIWRGVLNEMEVSLSRASFITWFKDTKIISKESGQIVISVPNGFVKEWVQNKFNKQIFQHLKQIDNNVREINYVVGNPFIKNPDPRFLLGKSSWSKSRKLLLMQILIQKQT